MERETDRVCCALTFSLIMKQELTQLGRSLPVPSVQELGKKRLTKLPPRYVRPDQDPPVISRTSPQPQVPIIVFQRLFSEDFKDSELERLHDTCKEWGFFQLINHEVSTSLLEKEKSGVQELFDLPMEEKKKLCQQAGDLEGFGQAFVVSEDQKLDWGDTFFVVTLPTCLRKPHLFPNLPPLFRDTLEAYSAELKAVTMKMLNLMAKALRMEATDIEELFEEGWQAMRMNYYPPCPQPELAIGLVPHSDVVGLTILLQVNEMEGLEINKNGMWIPINPLPNAFVVNIGDFLEVDPDKWYIPSIEHRATVNSKKERLSIATFYNPKMAGDIGPAPSLVTKETRALFRKVCVADYYTGYFSRELNGKSHINVVRIEDEEKKSV